jgi:hypothetical protein
MTSPILVYPDLKLQATDTKQTVASSSSDTVVVDSNVSATTPSDAVTQTVVGLTSTGKGVLILSDTNPPEKLKQLVSLNEFSASQFLNRNLDYFARINVKCLWINLNKDNAIQWLRLQELTNPNFTPVCITEGSSKSGWVKSIQEAVDDISVIKMKVIKQLNAINTDDFIKNLTSINYLKKPDTLLQRIASCFLGVLKKL